MTGIVRAARRPAGWVPPGPPPAHPETRPEPGEDLCYLAGDWRILQRVDGHRWSLDDLVTAWFAARDVEATPPARFADLGCGIGTVLMLLAWRFPRARGVGVEAQAVSVGLARRSLLVNGAANRCEIRLGDLRDPSIVPDAGFDLVTGTPPYLRPGTATESGRVQRGPCTVERRGGIEAYCASAARLLGPRGRFVVCAAAAQVERVEAAAAAAGLAIARRLDVVPRIGKAPLLSVYAMQARTATMIIEAPLVVRDAAAQRTAAFVDVRRAMGMPP